MINVRQYLKPIVLDTIGLASILLGVILIFASCNPTKPVIAPTVSTSVSSDTTYSAGVVNVVIPHEKDSVSAKVIHDTVLVIQQANGKIDTVKVPTVDKSFYKQQLRIHTQYAEAYAYINSAGILKLVIDQKESNIKVLKDSLTKVIRTQMLAVASVPVITPPPDKHPKLNNFIDNVAVYGLKAVLLFLCVIAIILLVNHYRKGFAQWIVSTVKGLFKGKTD